ncbi:FHA domain-containing serine/threonine-protein kinase [Anaerolineales bacterium HSG25]|nr:FHA domain-containing serine/threonine-protein kinase [Anaerolineales bacterium HSG25]
MENDMFIGLTVGGYEIKDVVGIGGMATVYKAYQASLDRWVAVKILHRREKNTLVRFKREAKVIARLRHPNILMVYSYGEQDGYPYMVIEHVENGTLRDKLDENLLNWKKVASLMTPVAEVLNYAHNKGVVHRDVKPSNILMPHDDWPLLADFGLIKVSEDWEVEDITTSGASMGTPAYMAPEQVRGVEIDARADMYALGVIIFEMVAGRLPFDYSNANKILFAHISEPVPSPKLFNPACPDALENVILTAMQKNPEDRYSSMQEMVAALKQASSSTVVSKQALEGTHTIMVSRSQIPDLAEYAQPDTKISPHLSSSQRTKSHIILVEQQLRLDLPNKNNIVIGRTHRNITVDVDLTPHGAAKAGISRRHVMLIRQGNDWFLDDLNSLNGTFINNRKVRPGTPIPIKTGDEVRCSNLIFQFVA